MLRRFATQRCFQGNARSGFYIKTSVATTLTASGAFLAFIFAPFEKSTYEARIGANVRFLRSVKIGALISIDYYIAGFGVKHLDEDSPEYKTKMSAVHTRSAEKILNGCLINGGTYIKIGQGLITLSHILPKEYITTLSLLQDKCLTRGVDEVERVFIQDFGRSPNEIFATFDYTAIAAASLAQVFIATTKNNEKVAVKVQYIDLQERFVTDVGTINFLLSIAGYLFPNFDFSWIIQDVVDNLRDELDFIKEADNTEQCAIDLKKMSFVHIPKVYRDLSSTRVLVTEFVDGIKISDIEGLKKDEHDLVEVNKMLFKAFGEQIFRTGFVHADPHPGNVFIRKHKNKSQLVLLDHGLYQRLTNETRSALSQFWKALVLKNHKNMKKFATELGVEDYVMLAEILTQRPLKSRSFRLVSKLSEEDLKYMSEFASKRFDLIMNTLKTMPRSLLLVTRNLNTIRSISHAHGDPIDRYTLLARSATKSIFSDSNFFKKIQMLPTWIYFEVQLSKNRFLNWFIKTYFNVLRLIGRSPDMKDMLSQLG